MPFRCFFDAWRYERQEHIVVPLLHSIVVAAQESGDQALKDHLQRALQAVLFSLKFSIAGVSSDAKSIRDQLSGPDRSPLDEAFSRPIAELQSLPATLRGKRVAVLVDDLDRCSSDKVVALVEAINLVMDVDGFIFLLALDYDVLVSSAGPTRTH
jgi:hypothetical protein